MEEWIKKFQENADINTRNQSASLKKLETQIQQLTKEIQSRTINEAPSSSTGQCKVAQNEEERTTEVLQCQLPHKELNPGNFTLPCTIGNFNFYGMADLGASVNAMPRNIFKYLRLANLGNTNMLVEMADRIKKAPLEALDPDKNPMEISFDDYKWVFDLEVEQLVDEYELGFGKKGHILEMIWENYKKI
ncbi:hypothetical protein Tco_1215957 [Tanacetum coccineum]